MARDFPACPSADTLRVLPDHEIEQLIGKFDITYFVETTFDLRFQFSNEVVYITESQCQKLLNTVVVVQAQFFFIAS